MIRIKPLCLTLIIILAAFLSTMVYAIETDNTEPEYDLGHGWVYGVDYKDLSKESERRIMEHYKFDYLENMPDVTRGIKSFDISSSGKVLISTNDYYILIINESGVYEYGFRFNYNGDYSALWSNDNVVYYGIKGDFACVLSNHGDIMKVYGFTKDYLEKTDYSYWRKIVKIKQRKINNFTYMIDKNTSQGVTSETIYRIDESGNREDIYTLSFKRSNSGMITFILSIVLGVLILFAYYKQKKGDAKYHVQH